MRKITLDIEDSHFAAFAGEEGKPKDGLVYEQQLRAEW